MTEKENISTAIVPSNYVSDNGRFNYDIVVQPLSKATETAFEEPHLKDTDYLYLWLNNDGTKFVAEPKCLLEEKDIDTGKITLKESEWPGPSYPAKYFFDRIPEKKYLGRGGPVRNRWELAGTDFTALIIYHCWPRDRIIFKAREDLPESEGARILYEFLLMRFFAQTHRAGKWAEFKINGELQEDPDDWLVHKSMPLSDYQKAAILPCMNTDALALFMDRGTGKTATVLQLICQQAYRKRKKYDKATEAGQNPPGHEKMYRAIVVCPPQVLLNWKEELHRFATAPGKVIIVQGTQEERGKQLIHGVIAQEDCLFSLIIVGYDSLSASIELFKKILWDIAIADESQKFKSAATKRWKTMMELRGRALARIVLTGTPIGNSIMDLWTQLEFLGEGLSGFQTFKAFKSFHGKWENVEGAPGIQALASPQNIPLLQERLSRVAFQITKKEAGLNLPDKVYDVRQVEMSEDQAKIYIELQTKLAIEIEETMTGAVNSMTVEHILTKLLRLAQITSGFVTWDPVVDLDNGEILVPRKVQQINWPNVKIDAVVDDIIEELAEDPLGKKIVWAVERESLQSISRRLKEKNITHGLYYGGVPRKERNALVKSFNCDPNFSVLVANPATAGEGLDLIGYDKDNPEDSKTYCDHELYFSQNWSYIMRAQSEDRAHRRGTRMPVRITDYIILDTIDQEIRNVVSAKKTMAEITLEIRGILKAILNTTNARAGTAWSA